MPVSKKLFLRAKVRSMNWSTKTKLPGASSARSEPTAESDRISVTPERFRASMLARKLSSLGGIGWPRPWRGRNTICWPSSSPNKSSSEGAPKGVSTLRQRVFSRPSMS
jgi:hypothetical protein